MEALGYGLLSIDEFYGLEDDFVPLWKPPSHEVMPTLYPFFFSNEPSTVLQIAHGLGAAFLIPFNSSDSYRVIPSEWGHSIVQLCGPEEQGYSEELNLIDFISQKKNGPVEWEDICSSRGLCYCYEFEAKETISEDIIKLIENDESDFIASKALANHFKFLMRFARMCAIGFTCNSVFIHYSVFNGGVQCLQKNFVQCREEFMHFTKGEWVSNVSVFIQTSNNNLSGNGVMYHSLLKTSRSEVERVNLSFL
jgi:glucokinase